MKFDFLHLRSLKTRITLFTLAIFLVSIWVFTLYAGKMLRRNMETQLSEQQFSTVSILASEVNEDLVERLGALEKVAHGIPASAVRNPAALQKLLEERPVLQSLFNAGIYATDRRGTAIADIPRSTGRIGVNYLDREYVKIPLEEGRSVIGSPIKGKKLNVPVIVIAVPVFDGHRTVIGAVMGVTDLGKSNFLEHIEANHYGRTGSFQITDRRSRLIVTSSDKSRIMSTHPAPGVIPAIDRFLEGQEGSAIYVNARGGEVLTSVKNIPIAGWNMVAILPTQEAFAPITSMEKRMLLAAISLTLLAGGAVWLLLRHSLAPAVDAARALAGFTGSEEAWQALPIVQNDEIGELVRGFNRLLAITQHQKTVLQDNESFLTALIDAIPMPVFYKDRDGRYLGVNRAFEEFFGETKERLIGRNAFDINPPELAKSYHAQDAALIANGGIQQYESEVQTAHGTLRRVIFTKAVFATGDGTVRGLIGAILDITERKNAEEHLQGLAQRLQLATRSAKLGVWDWDVVNNTMVWDERMLELYGYTAETFPGGIEAWQNGLHPEDRERTIAECQAALRGEKDWDTVFRVLCPDGTVRHLKADGIVLRNADNAPVRMLGINHDISERVHAEALVSAKNAELERFTYTVSHDLKSPLVTIKTFLGFLEQDLASNDPENAQADINFIHTAANKMLVQLNELLELSRVGSVVHEPARVTLRELAEEAVATVAGGIAMSGTAVSVEVPDLTLFGDRQRLVEVWQNLVENAVKYRGDQKAPRIEIGAEGAGPETVFFVRDNGMGIDPRHQSKVFGLFDKLDAKSEGSGLGLALVKRIVEMYKGRVWVESEGAGKGSCFKFTLPGAVREA